MAIVKVATGVPTTKSGHSCGDEDLTPDERMLLQSFPSQESDDCERVEVDCELAVSGGQMCSVPYGLYDLPELKDILSFEAWNLCLTEDDRFHLAAYLPDMDQHDFFTTMKELFSGSAMFFASPLRSFFHRLNGGFYSPEVSQARELLTIFQRRRHYHFLKSYHDGLILKFACMDKLWRSCDMGTSLEEKVHIWRNKRYEKLLTLANLKNSSNGSPSINGEAEAATFSQFKRAKFMDGTVSSHCSAKHKEIVHEANPVENSSSRSHIPNEPSEKWSKPRKGVLKIRTDCASLAEDNVGIGMIPLGQLGLHASTFSPYASVQDVRGFPMNSSYYYQMNTNGRSLGNSRSPGQREAALDTYPILAKSLSGAQRTVLDELKRDHHSATLKGYQSAGKHRLAYSSEAYDTRVSPHEKNLLNTFGRENVIIPESSPDPYTRTSDDHQRNGYMKMHNPRSDGSISQMLTLGTSASSSYNNFSGHSGTMSKYHDELKMNAPPAMKSVTEVEEGDRFPHTYTRRKLQKGLDHVDLVKKSTMVGSESSNVLASMANVKAKGIKL